MSGLIYDVVSSVLRRAGVRPSSSRVESESGADCVAVRVGTTRGVCRALRLFALPRSTLCPRSWSCRHCRLYFYDAAPPASSRCCTVQQYLFVKTATSEGRGGVAVVYRPSLPTTRLRQHPRVRVQTCRRRWFLKPTRYSQAVEESLLDLSGAAMMTRVLCTRSEAGHKGLEYPHS